jgi:glyoxylate utilization-related uncharacterized protein
MIGLGAAVTRWSADETAGEAVVVEALMWPGGPVAAFESEPEQERRFDVIGGWIGFEIDGRVQVVGEGTRVTVAPGQSCRIWNAALDDAQFVCEARPALEFEQEVHELFRPRRFEPQALLCA